MPKEERRNISKLYNKMTIGELQTMVPEIPWLEYINRVLHPFFSVSHFICHLHQILSPLVNLASLVWSYSSPVTLLVLLLFFSACLWDVFCYPCLSVLSQLLYYTSHCRSGQPPFASIDTLTFLFSSVSPHKYFFPASPSSFVTFTSLVSSTSGPYKLFTHTSQFCYI